MKKLRLFLWVTGILAFFCPNLSAQKTLTKIVVDSRTKNPVDYVFIRSDDGNTKQLSNKDGKFIIISDLKAKSFAFYKMGYQLQNISMQNLLIADTVFMVEKPFELEEVVIKNKKIDTIVKDKRFYVDDYTVLSNGNFLIITSKINVKGFDVCYYDKIKGIRQTHKIKNEQDAHFVTDCFKNIHVVSAGFSRQVFFNSDSSFEFLPKYARKLFDSVLAPCVLKIDTQVIMKHTLPSVTIHLPDYDIQQNSPVLNYYRVSRHTREPFYTVFYNERMREMIAHELSDWSLLGPVDDKVANNISLFFRKIAGPLYAPVFLKNDTVVLFNFQEETIVFFNKTGLILNRVKMHHELVATIRDFEIVYDGVAQTFYIKMKEADKGVIRRINIYSGTASKTIKLEKIFARNIQIVNDKIYYLVREKEWDDTQYLYQQN